MLGERLKRAREAAGHSLRSLAAQVAISHTLLSQYEKGQKTPDSGVLVRLARAVGVRSEYFLRPVEYSLEGLEFRSRSGLRVRDEKRIRAEVLDQVERRLELESLFPAHAQGFEAPANLPERVADEEAIEDLAILLRQAWGLGEGPIADMVDTLEGQGFRVVMVDVDASARFDGLTAEVGGHPVVVVGRYWPGDRQRFTLAHELGHRILSGRLGEGLEEEKACNRFAGAFLAPRDAVLESLGPNRAWLEPQELAMLKEEYGLSMLGWVIRARQLGVLKPSNYERMARYFSKHGWRKQEPHTYPAEKAHLFPQMVYRALGEQRISESKAAELLAMPLAELRAQRNLEAAHAPADQ